MATIDQLQIEITASSRQASASIDKLVNKLQGLSGALNLNLSDSLPTSLNELNVSMASLNTTIATMQIDKIKNLSSAFGSLSKIPNNTAALDATVTSLTELGNISISADSVNGIVSLSNAMGKLGGKASAGAAASLRPIAEGLRMLPEVVPAGENYIQLANGLAKLGGVKVQSAAGLVDVARGLRELGEVGNIPNMAGLTELGQALSVFGRQTAQNAVVVIPQIANAFRQLIQTLSKAPVISQRVIDLARAMADLTANTGRANGAIGRTTPLLSNLGSSASRAKKSFGGLAATIGKIYATYWLLFRAFGKIKEAINFGSALVEVQNVVDTVFGDAKKKVESFADSAITSFGLSELSAKQFASKYQAMGSAMGITNAQVVKANTYLDKALEGSKRKVDGYTDSYKKLGTTLADMSINMTKLTADVGSFYNMDYEEVATKMASVWTGQTRPMREFGIDLTQATLQEWMLNRGIDGNIKKMTQAEKTMIRYQYVMEQLGHVMNDYARTADTWANVTRTIGEQFRKLGGIVGTGFINAFRPALVKFRDFMNTMIDLVEKGLNAIGKLLGWQIEISEVGLTEDADAVGDIADGLGDAAGNAKKLNEQLMGFDRLNNITTPKDKSGSGSGSGATGGGGGSTKATDPEVTWKKYESKIQTWWDLGDTISGTIADSLEKIDWKTIKEKADKFGRNFAQLLNGLFAGKNGQRLFEALGTTIAESINTVMTAAKTWSKTLKWANIGKNIKKGLEKFLEKWNPTISGQAVGGIVKGIASAVYNLVSDKETWKLLGSKVSEGINAFLDTMSEEDEEGRNGWQNLFGDVSAIVTGLGAAINEAIGEIDWDEMLKGFWDGLVEFFTSMDEDTITGILAIAALSGVGRRVIGGLVKAIFSDFISTVATSTGLAGASAAELLPAIAIPLTFYFVWKWGSQGSGETDSIWGTEKSNFKKAWDDMIESISNFFSKKGTATEWNGQEVEIQIPLKERLRIAKQEFKDFIHNNPPENIAKNLWGWLQKTAKSIWDKFKEAWGDNKFVQVGIKLFEGALGLLWMGITNDWGLQKTLNVLLAYFDNAVDKLWASVQNKWSDKKELKVWIVMFKAAIGTLWSAVNKDWSGATRNLEIGLKFAADALSSLWQQLVDYFTGRKVEIKSETTPEVKEPKNTSRHSGGTHTREKGGSFYDERWHNIAQFASGGRPSHGSMFVAGENGAEVVGHIGGRSEVLNESQMASVMYDAVSDAMATQNAILIKQNQLLSGILAKDYGISSSDIFAATQREASNYTMRTGRPAFN